MTLDNDTQRARREVRVARAAELCALVVLMEARVVHGLSREKQTRQEWIAAMALHLRIPGNASRAQWRDGSRVRWEGAYQHLWEARGDLEAAKIELAALKSEFTLPPEDEPEADIRVKVDLNDLPAEEKAELHCLATRGFVPIMKGDEE